METGLAEQLFISLESNQPHVVEDVKTKFHELFNSCNPNDTWLVNGLFDYSMQTGSLRTVEILVGIREPHDTHLFNKFSESLRGAHKQQALTLLGHVVRRQPTWLFKITRHTLFKDLLKLLKVETEVIALLSALLVINVLLPMVACLMEPHLNDLFSAFSHLATWNSGGGGGGGGSKLSSAHLLHLQMALYALFLRLYAMYPCNLLSYLRHEYGQPHKMAVFSHTIKPMLDNVKMHPFLITASKDYEVNQSRWRRMEPHDVVVECAKFAIVGEPDMRSRDEDVPLKSSFDFSQALESKYRRCSVGAGDKELLYSPTSYCGMSTPPESAPTSIPHTPSTQTHVLSSSFPQQEGTSPPEAAVEATPETTPIKDLRPVSRGGPPVTSSVPRALNSMSPGNSQPCSPLHKQPSPSPFRFPSTAEPSAFHELRRDSIVTQKMQRIVYDRIQLSADYSRVASVQGPPSPLRLITPDKERDRDSPAPLELDQEDREVEITMTSDSLSQNLSWHGEGRQLESAAPDDEMESECPSDCARGGICMPSADHMRAFTRQVKSRLRFYSQCQDPASYTGQSPGSSPSDRITIPVNQFRRANSCPEIKKSCLSMERHPVEKVDEEPCPLNGHAEATVGGSETVSTATQTDNPLPYEHLFLAVFPAVEPPHHHDDHANATDTANSSPLPQKTFSPTQVDAYMNISVSPFSDTKKIKTVGVDELRDQLLLMSLQLHFERHRREMHAERNRRLLGQSRKVRSQEELTSALKDQVALLQNDKEVLHSDLHQRVAETKGFAQQLQESVNYYQQENSALQINYTKERNLRESSEQELKQERDKTANVTKDLNEARAQLSLAQAELCRTSAEAGEGRELRARLMALQRDVVVGGEARERYRRRLEDLAARAHHAAEAGLADRAAQHQINALEHALAGQTAAADAARARAAELEAAVGRRDAAVADTKRLLKVAKHEYCEQLEAVECKYSSLRAVNSRLEGELLRLRHMAGEGEEIDLPLLPAPAPAPPHALVNLQALVDLPGDAADSLPHSDHNG